MGKIECIALISFGIRFAPIKGEPGGDMSKILKFPDKNFRQNTREVVDLQTDKNKFSLVISIFTLVLAVSIINNKSNQKTLTPQRGHRGIASVGALHGEFDQSSILKQLKVGNIKKTARLGRKPNMADELLTQGQNYAFAYDEDDHLVSVNIVNNQDPSYFQVSTIEKSHSLFGLDQIDCPDSEEERLGLKVIHCNGLNPNGELIKTIVLNQDTEGRLLELQVQPALIE